MDELDRARRALVNTLVGVVGAKVLKTRILYGDAIGLLAGKTVVLDFKMAEDIPIRALPDFKDFCRPSDDIHAVRNNKPYRNLSRWNRRNHG